MKAKEALFISDLHLSIEKPELVRYFLDFLERRAPQAERLYILGDLFDSWVGDDDYTPPNAKIRKALKLLTQSGTQVYFQSGNRDFLIGEKFAAETGVTLLGDFAVIDLFGQDTLITHGDLLCTDDLPYQAFRKKSRDPDWQANILAKPLLIRLLAARWYRLRSFFHKRKKLQEIMDVNQNTVINVMQAHQTTLLIHGHTHRPAVHNFLLGDRPAQRMVLPDWNNQKAEVLCWNTTGYSFESLI